MSGHLEGRPTRPAVIGCAVAGAILGAAVLGFLGFILPNFRMTTGVLAGAAVGTLMGAGFGQALHWLAGRKHKQARLP